MAEKIVELFKKVQRIPYKVCKFEKEKIDSNLKFGDCRHKNELLGNLLEKEGYEVRKVKVLFDWRDLPLPEEIIKVLKNSDKIWAHEALMVKVGDRWLKVDCSWNPELEKKGFPIQKEWGGKSDTLQVTKGKLKFIDKEDFDKKIININRKEAIRFAELLNNYLYFDEC